MITDGGQEFRRLTCGQCRFWERGQGPERMTDGDCHLNPRTIGTDERHWCGQGVARGE